MRLLAGLLWLTMGTGAARATEPASPASPVSTPAGAGAPRADRWFGSGPVDYWGGQPYGVGPGMMSRELEAWRPEEIERKRSGPSESAARAGPSSTGTVEPDWDELMDPRSEAFWREGDHVPPAQLMAVIRDPSPANVERYRQWQKKKLEVTGWVSQLVTEPDERPPVDWSDVTVVYFYAMGCSVCARNAPVVDELMELGAHVLPVHLDRPSPRWPSSTPWSEQMAAGVQLTGTPTWVLVQGDERTVLRGYADLERIEGVLR